MYSLQCNKPWTVASLVAVVCVAEDDADGRDDATRFSISQSSSSSILPYSSSATSPIFTRVLVQPILYDFQSRSASPEPQQSAVTFLATSHTTGTSQPFDSHHSDGSTVSVSVQT